jgi:hypothetical protein
MAVLKSLFGPLPAFLRGLTSYRVITAIEQGDTERALKHISRRNLFKLAQVPTNFSPLHVACTGSLTPLVEAMLHRKDVGEALNSQDNPVGVT